MTLELLDSGRKSTYHRGGMRIAGMGARCIGLVMTISMGACFLLPTEEEILAPPLMEPPEITYRVLQAPRKTIANKIIVTGYFVFSDQISLFFHHRSGPLKQIYVTYGDRVSAGALLAELDTDSLALSAIQQEIELEKAQLIHERAVALGADRFEQRIAALGIRQAELRLAQLRDELAKARIRAPFEGEIVYIARAEEGQHISTYQTVVQIADPSQLYLAYRGTRASEFNAGRAVTTVVAGTEYPGVVIMTPANVPFDARDDARDTVLVRVDGLPADVTKGDAGVIHLTLDQRENAIVLPRHVVQTYLGRRFIYVLEDGLRSERTVEIGIQTPTEVEIVTGVREGENVVIR